MDDLDAICLFISRDSFYYARLFAQRVFAATDRLKIFPMSGRAVPELEQESIREIILDGYRIIYRMSQETVAILAVHHGAREIDESLTNWLSFNR